MEENNQGTGIIIGLTVLFLGVASFFVIKGLGHSKEAQKKAKEAADAKAKEEEDKKKKQEIGIKTEIVSEVSNIKLDKELGLKVGAAAQSFLGLNFGVKSSPNTTPKPKQNADISEDAFKNYIVNASTLFIREKPNASSKKIASLKRGDIVLVKNSNVKGWGSYSEDGINVIGYVSSQYLK